MTDEEFERRCRAVLFVTLAWMILGPLATLVAYLLTD